MSCEKNGLMELTNAEFVSAQLAVAWAAQAALAYCAARPAGCGPRGWEQKLVVTEPYDLSVFVNKGSFSVLDFCGLEEVIQISDILETACEEAALDIESKAEAQAIANNFRYMAATVERAMTLPPDTKYESTKGVLTATYKGVRQRLPIPTYEPTP